MTASPRAVSPGVVVDANVLVSAVLGRATERSLAAVAGRRALLIGEGAVDEARTVIARVRPAAAPALDDLLRLFQIVAVAADEAAAATALRQAPPSRNGSTDDAPVLALAWSLDADIWSHDRDFAGTGWPCWSSANLLTALEVEA